MNMMSKFYLNEFTPNIESIVLRFSFHCPFTPVRWSDGMWCRSDWLGFCLFWCYQPSYVNSQQSWFGLFLFHKFPIFYAYSSSKFPLFFPPPPPDQAPRPVRMPTPEDFELTAHAIFEFRDQTGSILAFADYPILVCWMKAVV